MSLPEAKAWLRVTRDNEDTIIKTLINASVLWAEGYCKRIFAGGSFELYSDSYDFTIPNAPISDVTLSYLSGGSYVEIDSENYKIDVTQIESCIVFNDGYDIPDYDTSIEAIKVTYDGGYTDVTLPASIKQAILCKIASLYDNRTEENQRWMTSAELLLMPYRIFNI